MTIDELLMRAAVGYLRPRTQLIIMAALLFALALTVAND